MTASTDAALKGGSSQLRRRSSFNPWNNPQSIKTRPRSDSTKYFEPVTVPAAPQKESVGMRAMLTDYRDCAKGVRLECGDLSPLWFTLVKRRPVGALQNSKRKSEL